MTRADETVVAATPATVQHDKKNAIQKYQQHKKDTGSVQVQAALLTSRINGLTEHLKVHAKDNHSRRGLIQMVSKRRKLLDYLKTRKIEDYQKLIVELGIRK